MKNLADSGLLIALLDRADAHHAWAIEVIDSVAPPFLTCEAVVAEVAAVLGSGDPVLRMIERGDVVIDFDLQAETSSVRALMHKYRDCPMDLADACIVRMTEQHRDSRVFTVDRADFTIYRRHGRQPIPFIAPKG